jgi:tRNA A37 methylthiotransferase MiaB
MRIYIETYGCSSSRNDSEIMAGLLRNHLVDKIEEADIIIINTCIVKEHTENKMISRIKSVQEKYPGKKLIITGCMPEAEPECLRRIVPSASLVSTNKINEIEKAVNEERIELIGKEKINKACLPKIRKNPVVNIVEICSGCSQSCSYCITKLAKGSLFCYPPEEIVKEIKSAYKDGCREFWRMITTG